MKLKRFISFWIRGLSRTNQRREER